MTTEWQEKLSVPHADMGVHFMGDLSNAVGFDRFDKYELDSVIVSVKCHLDWW